MGTNIKIMSQHDKESSTTVSKKLNEYLFFKEYKLKEVDYTQDNLNRPEYCKIKMMNDPSDYYVPIKKIKREKRRNKK